MPTAWPRDLRGQASPAASSLPGSCSFSATRASVLPAQYLEPGCVRREAPHIELGPGTEPAKEIVRIHLYPESSAVPPRLRRGPLPEGLALDRGWEWLWGGAEPGRSEGLVGFSLAKRCVVLPSAVVHLFIQKRFTQSLFCRTLM